MYSDSSRPSAVSRQAAASARPSAIHMGTVGTMSTSVAFLAGSTAAAVCSGMGLLGVFEKVTEMRPEKRVTVHSV